MCQNLHTFFEAREAHQKLNRFIGIDVPPRQRPESPVGAPDQTNVFRDSMLGSMDAVVRIACAPCFPFLPTACWLLGVARQRGRHAIDSSVPGTGYNKVSRSKRRSHMRLGNGQCDCDHRFILVSTDYDTNQGCGNRFWLDQPLGQRTAGKFLSLAERSFGNHLPAPPMGRLQTALADFGKGGGGTTASTV